MSDRPAPAAPTRALVIGCGAIAHEHLRFLSRSPAVELAGVCDRSRAVVDFVRDLSGAGAAFTDHRAALAALRPDVVHVLTPPDSHAGIVRDALAAGAHVVCEKPMTGTAAETGALLAEAARHGRLLIESRNMLFNDVAASLDALVREGQLGVVREVDVVVALDFLAGPFGDRNLAGPGVAVPAGAVHDFVPHLVYLFLHFAGPGAVVEDVAGYLENRSGNRRAGFDHLDALIRTSACRGRLRVLADVKPDQFRLTLHGSKGLAETDFYNPSVKVQSGAATGVRAPFAQVRSGLSTARWGARNLRDKVLQHGPYHGMDRMLDAFYRAVREGGPSPIAPADILAAAALVDRIVELGATR